MADVRVIDDFMIDDHADVKVVRAGNIIEVVYSRANGGIARYRRLDKDCMVDLETGEVIEVKHGDSRADNMRSLRETIKRGRLLINANFVAEENELFITLTYRENMQDTVRLMKDFEKFWKKLKRRYRETDFRYITAVEPQERGAWHLHVLVKALNQDWLYIPKEIIRDLWGHGEIVDVRRLTGKVDNVGAYVSAYLTNTEWGGKGSRLHFYPAGINIFRCSRNCVKAEIERCSYGDIKERLGEAAKTFERSYEVTEGVETVNKVKREYYNLVRKV